MISSLGVTSVLDGVITHAWSWQRHFILCQPIVPLPQGTGGPAASAPPRKAIAVRRPPWAADTLDLVSWGGDPQCWAGDTAVLFQLPETERI